MYGVYEEINGEYGVYYSNEYGKQLILRCNQYSNAEVIAEILNCDASDRNWLAINMLKNSSM